MVIIMHQVDKEKTSSMETDCGKEQEKYKKNTSEDKHPVEVKSRT